MHGLSSSALEDQAIPILEIFVAAMGQVSLGWYHKKYVIVLLFKWVKS